MLEAFNALNCIWQQPLQNPSVHIRLKNEGGFDEYEAERERERDRAVVRSGSLYRFKGVHIRRRSFRLKVPSLRKLRRKVRLFRVSCAKVLKRLKESQAHFGDLFAGNYLFMQVNPTSLEYLEKSCKSHGPYPTPRYSLPRSAA
ncbi:hypothetical protein CFOL_v3_27888 [Cephalotus follicularis]|uniref:Uncharacterized protein n=1 Tax=Cephalotus follicularis TaxID=3775 RepID=A0A1Q3CW37_CEPFO|nr:hypothetical protein CFOL_v3_27888 [Cephalotus follicularis]